jgi:hypothetical protein
MTAACRGGRFLGHYGRHGDAAPDRGCDGLTQAKQLASGIEASSSMTVEKSGDRI